MERSVQLVQVNDQVPQVAFKVSHVVNVIGQPVELVRVSDQVAVFWRMTIVNRFSCKSTGVVSDLNCQAINVAIFVCICIR